MPTQLTEIIFNSIPDGFFPTFPPNWVKKTPDTTRILGGNFLRSGSTEAAVKYNIPFATSEIEVSMLALASGTSSSAEAGVQFLDASNNGYVLICVTSGSNFIVRVKTVNNWVYGTQLFTNTFVAAGNHDKPLRLRRNRATGQMNVWLDTVQLGSSFTDNTYDPTYGSVTSMGGSVRSITLTDLSEYAVNSFNSSDDIERGQQDITYTTTGFSVISAITSDQSGVTFSGINDSTGDGTVDISDYVEGGLYPLLPATVINTFSDGLGNTAQITKTLAIKSTDSSVITSGMVTINDSWLGYLLDQAGRSVADGGQIIWPTSSGVTFGADGSINNPSGTEVTVNIWYRDPANGRMYNYDLTVTSTGEIVSFASTSRIGIGIGIGI